jgi:hypothetical protein
MRIIHTADAALAKALSSIVALTVEAEYGSIVVEGSVYTAAHHQPSGPYVGDHVVAGGRPSPCNDRNIPTVETGLEHDSIILVSHFDLDTVGGVLRACLYAEPIFKPEFDAFWALAAFVDVNGVHKRHLSGATDHDQARLDAWWAWADKHVPRLPREGITDVTALMESAYTALAGILIGDSDYMMEAGRRRREAEASLNAASFVAMDEGVGLLQRVASAENPFVNHLYTAPSGAVGRAIVAYNPVHGSVTVSLADPVPGVSCRDLVQALWGPLAGGHAGIAGSPRGQAMTQEDVQIAAQALREALLAASAA